MERRCGRLEMRSGIGISETLPPVGVEALVVLGLGFGDVAAVGLRWSVGFGRL